jgi:Helix-turn-helix domain
VTRNQQEDLLSLLDDRIRRIAREVLQTQLPSVAQPTVEQKSEQITAIQQRIMCKEFVSIKEAALLLNCSDGHIRNLVRKAQYGKASNPIPFLDLDGVTVFPRVKLLEWAEQPKRKLRAVG